MKQKSNPIGTLKIQRELRYFSAAARQAIVEEIDKGLSKAEASWKYKVSKSVLYKWLSKYSTHHTKPLVKVVEHTRSKPQLIPSTQGTRKFYQTLLQQQQTSWRSKKQNTNDL